MHLFHYPESSASFRVRIALALKGIDVQYTFVDIRNGAQHEADYVVRNPQRMVPFLCDEDISIGQSIAILEYLEEVRPSPPLLPAEAKSRAVARSLMQQIVSDAGPFQKTTLQHYMRHEHGFADAQIANWLDHWMSRALVPIETFLISREIDSRFAMGEEPTFVECCLIPQLHNARKFGVSLNAYPKLLDLESTCLSHPAFCRAHPSAFE